MANKLPNVILPNENENYVGAETEAVPQAVGPIGNNPVESPASKELVNKIPFGKMTLSTRTGDPSTSIYQNHLGEIRMVHPKMGDGGEFDWVHKDNLKKAIEEGFLPVSQSGRMKEIGLLPKPMRIGEDLIFLNKDTDSYVKVKSNEVLRAHDAGLRPVDEWEYASRRSIYESKSQGSPISAFVGGFLRDSTLGVSDFIIPEETTKILSNNYPISTAAGQLASYLVPFGVASSVGKAVGNVVKYSAGLGTKSIIPLAVRGASEGIHAGTTKLVSDYAMTDYVPSAKKIAAEIGINAAIGGILSPVIFGLGSAAILGKNKIYSLIGNKIIDKIPEKNLNKLLELETKRYIINSDLKQLDSILNGLSKNEAKEVRNLIKQAEGFRLNNKIRETAGALDDSDVLAENDLITKLNNKLESLKWFPKSDVNIPQPKYGETGYNTKISNYFDIIEADKNIKLELSKRYSNIYKGIGDNLSGVAGIGAAITTMSLFDAGVMSVLGVGIGTALSVRPIVASIFKNSLKKTIPTALNVRAGGGFFESAASQMAGFMNKNIVSGATAFGERSVIAVADQISNSIKKYKEFSAIKIINDEQFKQERSRLEDINPEEVINNALNGYIQSNIDAESAQRLAHLEGIKTAWLKQFSTKDRISYSKAAAAIDLRGVIYRLGNDMWTKEDLEFSRMAYPQLWSNLILAAQEMENDIYDLKPNERKLVGALIKQNNTLGKIIQFNYIKKPNEEVGNITGVGSRLPTQAATTNLLGGK